MKNEKSNFLNFVTDNDFYQVTRILDYPDRIVKDLEKSKEFQNKEDAIKYFNLIKMDFVKECTVLTAIFLGTVLDKEFWKIRKCGKPKELKLDL